MVAGASTVARLSVAPGREPARFICNELAPANCRECGLLAGGDMVENFEVPLAVKASQEMLKKIDEGTSD